MARRIARAADPDTDLDIEVAAAADRDIPVAAVVVAAQAVPWSGSVILRAMYPRCRVVVRFVAVPEAVHKPEERHRVLVVVLVPHRAR